MKLMIAWLKIKGATNDTYVCYVYITLSCKQINPYDKEIRVHYLPIVCSHGPPGRLVQ